MIVRNLKRKEEEYELSLERTYHCFGPVHLGTVIRESETETRLASLGIVSIQMDCPRPTPVTVETLDVGLTLAAEIDPKIGKERDSSLCLLTSIEVDGSRLITRARLTRGMVTVASSTAVTSSSSKTGLTDTVSRVLAIPSGLVVLHTDCVHRADGITVTSPAGIFSGITVVQEEKRRPYR